MDLADRQSSGHLDISDETKRGNGLLGSLRKPMPCTMYYEVFGTGPKKLFLIMGMLGTTMYWRLQSRYFANHGDYTVCVFDNRGSGKSTIAPGPYKISQMARDATRLLDHLGWTHGIHMVGISLGGMVAQELCLLNNEQDPTASEFPRFESVVLVDTWHSAALALPTVEELRFSFNGMAAFGDDPKHLIKLVFSPEWIRAPFHDAAAKQGDPPSPEMDAPVLTNKDVMGRLFRAVQDDLGIHRGRTGDTKAAERTGSPLVNAGGIAAEKQPRLHHSRSATSPSHPTQPPPSMAQSKTTHTTPSSSKREASGDIHQFIACLGHRLSSTRVRSIRTYNPRTRFLVIHGERDRVIRPFCGRALAKLLECPVVWIAGAGHMPPIDAHCSFNLVVRAFTLNERWLRDLPDRTCLVPPTWDEQVKAHQWISRESKSTDLELDLGDPSSPEPVVHLAWVDGPPKPRGRRVSRVDCIQPVGPLPKELLLIDETDPECAARVIPANVPAPMIGGSRDPTTTSSLQSIAEWLSPAPTIPASVPSSAASSPPPQTRELLACGVLVDAPFRIRRYSRPHHHHHPTPNDI
ncbi:hypothetical protein EV175_004057 [Coemansia sp. RSA 1933]|nr:hypothetical protein EV175_004057 [Coemansia sp. RSA 1933]